MNNTIELLQENRQLLMLAASDVLSREDLDDIHSLQLLNDLSDPSVLKVLQLGFYSIDHIKLIFNNFQSYYLSNEALYREALVSVAVADLSSKRWAFINAETLMSLFIRTVISQADQPCNIQLMSDLSICFGPKVVYIIQDDCIDALNEGRVTWDDLHEMSIEDLIIAINENQYPKDSSRRMRT